MMVLGRQGMQGKTFGVWYTTAEGRRRGELGLGIEGGGQERNDRRRSRDAPDGGGRFKIFMMDRWELAPARNSFFVMA
jgi:hypothetical protein